MIEPVLIERRGAVVILKLSNPLLRNALADDMMLTLVRALHTANDDPEVRCVILMGDPAGRAFSSGASVREIAKGDSPMFSTQPVIAQEGYRRIVQQIPMAFNAIEVPVIAAIDGYALGAALDITAMCDIRIATPDAKFAESFVRIGLISGDGGAWYLQRAIGYARALELALTAATIDADRALEIGLVSRIVPSELLLDEALALATQIATHPREAIRLTKRLFRNARSVSLEQSLEHGAAAQAIVQTTADHREAIAALLEKRTPQFQGR